MLRRREHEKLLHKRAATTAATTTASACQKIPKASSALIKFKTKHEPQSKWCCQSRWLLDCVMPYIQMRPCSLKRRDCRFLLIWPIEIRRVQCKSIMMPEWFSVCHFLSTIWLIIRRVWRARKIRGNPVRAKSRHFGSTNCCHDMNSLSLHGIWPFRHKGCVGASMPVECRS